MGLLNRLQKVASMSAALRKAYLDKQAGFATALSGLGKSIANQVTKSPIGGTLSVGMGMSTAAGVPKQTAGSFKANKAGFNPAVHKAQMGLEG